MWPLRKKQTEIDYKVIMYDGDEPAKVSSNEEIFHNRPIIPEFGEKHEHWWCVFGSSGACYLPIVSKPEQIEMKRKGDPLVIVDRQKAFSNSHERFDYSQTHPYLDQFATFTQDNSWNGDFEPDSRKLEKLERKLREQGYTHEVHLLIGNNKVELPGLPLLKKGRFINTIGEEYSLGKNVQLNVIDVLHPLIGLPKVLIQ